MPRYRRISTLCLSIVILGSITACNRSNTTESEQTYLANRIESQTEIGEPLSAAKLNNNILMLCLDNNGYNIISIAQNGNNQIVDNSYIMSFEGNNNVSGFTVTNDRKIVLIQEVDSTLKVCQFLEDGTVDFEIDLNLSDSDNLGVLQNIEVISVLTDSSGQIYIAWRIGDGANGVVALSQNGNVLFTLSCSDAIHSIALLDENTPVVLLNGDTLKTINTTSGNWGERTDLKGNYSGMYTGNNGIVYLDDGKYLNEYNYNNKSMTRLLGWGTLGVSQPNWVIAENDSAFVIYSIDTLYRLQRETGDTPSDTREVIALATSNAGRITTEVWEFNETNEQYRIEVSEYTEDDIDRLLTQISSGDIPDIFFFSMEDLFSYSLSSQVLGAKGYLADLYEYIDDDEELSRSNFQTNILNTVTEGESLYELPYEFWIDTVAGDASVLGSKNGWTFDDMLETLEDLSIDGYLFGPNLPSDIVLELMLSYNLDEYVDWNNGTCTFDTPEFQKLLEIIYLYTPDKNEESYESELELISNGDQLLMRQHVGTTNYMQVFDFYFDDTVLIGFPTTSGIGNSILSDGSFSISATTDHGDAAWSFIRQFYTVDYYIKNEEIFAFPINAEALELKYDHVDIEFKIGVGDEAEQGSYTMEIGEPTENDVNRTRDLITSLDRVYRSDSNIYNIVLEEAQSYFEGNKTIEDVTAIIQNRVQTYVAEQLD